MKNNSTLINMHSIKPVSDIRQRWVETTLSTLSLREKIGQTVQEICNDETCQSREHAVRYFEKNPVGSVFCGGEIIKGAGNSAELIRERLDLCQEVSRIPLLVAGDLEHGAGAAVRGLTSFPHNLALGAVNDESLAYALGKYTALEGRYAGFNWTFSPVVDLAQNWMNPIVNNRSIGDNPKRVVPLAQAIIRGLQDHSIAACAKHFPGDGVDFRDQHLVTSINYLSEEEWWTNHGRVFQSVIDDGVYSIMPGHIALPWFEPMVAGQKRPRPASASKKLLTELLRQRMGFTGVVVSDALIMAGYTGWADREKRLIESVNAGVDVMLWPGTDYFEILERALDDGRVSLQRLDESVRRILTLKARLGLADLQIDSRSVQNETSLPLQIRSEAEAASREIAQRSITLVRNREHLLPLDSKKVKRVLLHKAVPTDAGADAFKHLDRFIDSLKARGLDVTVLQNGNCLDVSKLEESGQRWDAYLVFYSSQGHQIKNSIRPVGPMAEVIWTQQNVETVKPITISLATPFLLYDMPFLDTLVNAYSTSPYTMEALEAALFGESKFNDDTPVDVGGDGWIMSTCGRK